MRGFGRKKGMNKNANSTDKTTHHHVGHNYDVIGMFDVHNSTNVLTSKVYRLCFIVISLLYYASGLRLKSRIDVINHSLRNAGICDRRIPEKALRNAILVN